jgi:1,4-dihydroxy-2-naphthoate octaprenyltransferase
MTHRIPLAGLGKKVGIWARITRAGFLFGTGTICVPLGAAVAWYDRGVFSPGYLALTWLAAILLVGAGNIFNEYFDYEQDTKEPEESLTPFSGGSRVLQEGLIPRRSALLAGFLHLVLVILIGIFLAVSRSLLILPLGLWGVFTAYFYISPPVSMGSRGIGELLAGLNCGPLMALGSYLVQVGTFSWSPILATLAPGFLLGSLLWICELPDMETDRQFGKRTLIVRMGKEKAASLYPVFLALTYISLIGAIAVKILPISALLALLTLPLAVRIARIVARHHSNTASLIPGLAGHIQLTVLFIILLMAGILIPIR